MVKVIRGATNDKPTMNAAKPGGNAAKKSNATSVASCKWCQKRQCWDHGQIAKAGGNKPGIAAKPGMSFKFGGKPSVNLNLKQPAGKLHSFAVKKLGVKPTFGKFAIRGSVGLAAKKPGLNGGKKASVKVAGCRWCTQGQCWTHGQVAKPGAAAAVKAPIAMKAMPAMKVGVAFSAGKFGMAGVKKPLLKNKAAHPGKAHPVKGKVTQATAKPNARANNAKNELGAGLQLLRGRAMTKDDWMFNVEKENGKFVATLNLDDLPIDRTEFKGKPGADQKEAEANAAQKALNCLQDNIRKARAEKEAAKKDN